VWNKELVKKLVEYERQAEKWGRKLGLRPSTTNDPTDVFYVLTPPPAPIKK